MFTGAAKGTNKELFKALAKSDLDGLLTLSPFQAQTKHLQPWGTSPRIDKAMKAVRTANAAVLKPFGLDKSGTPPAGDLSQFFFHCFDIVFIKAPDPDVLTVKGAPLASADRQTLLAFVGEILNQLTRRLEGKSVGGRKVNTADLEALRASVTSIPFDDIGLPPGQSFDLDLDNTTLNSFPSLKAIVTAIQGGFRKQLDAARSKMSATTLFDIRGCRAAQDAEYVTSVSEFLGKPGGAHPTVTAPQLFQAYMEFMFDTVRDRASIRTWLSRERRHHSPQQLRENLTTWAELIRVRPLHTDFWSGLLEGPAVRFAATTWPAEIPKLFIPAPGLEKLPTTDIGQMIARAHELLRRAEGSGPERRGGDGDQGGRSIGDSRRADAARAGEGADRRRAPQAAVRRPEGHQRGRGADDRSRHASEPAARGRHRGISEGIARLLRRKAPRRAEEVHDCRRGEPEGGRRRPLLLHVLRGAARLHLRAPGIAEELDRGVHTLCPGDSAVVVPLHLGRSAAQDRQVPHDRDQQRAGAHDASARRRGPQVGHVCVSPAPLRLLHGHASAAPG